MIVRKMNIKYSTNARFFLTSAETKENPQRTLKMKIIWSLIQ